jgi:hypothetical protein
MQRVVAVKRSIFIDNLVFSIATDRMKVQNMDRFRRRPRRPRTRAVMTSTDDAYDELRAYTLTHGDPTFIHQHVVDAFAAQHADTRTKPITLTFALIGLYLHVEERLTGRQVQLVHMRLARRKRRWPAWTLPHERGVMTAADVMLAAPGIQRDKAIDAWCESVWEAFQAHREAIVELLREDRIDFRARPR